MMKPLFGLATLALLLILAPVARAADAPPAAATPPSAAAAAPDVTHTFGNPNAPITVNEYVSLTCPHCAEFYDTVMPDLKKQYVDTGKVKFVLHPFARDGVDLGAFTLASCMPEDEYFPFVSVLFQNQAGWITQPDPSKVLMQYAALGGLGTDKAKACLADTKTQDAIAASVKEATDKFGVQATPTFIIDPGATKVEGSRSVQEFGAMFDKLLAAKK